MNSQFDMCLESVQKHKETINPNLTEGQHYQTSEDKPFIKLCVQVQIPQQKESHKSPPLFPAPQQIHFPIVVPSFG